MSEISFDSRLASSKHHGDSVLDNQFVHSLLYSLQSPADTLAQVAGQRVELVAPPAPPQNGKEWVEQQLGTVAGALPYLVVIHQMARRTLSSKILSADTRILHEAGLKLGPCQAAQVMRLELATSGLTGGIYGGFLTPVQEHELANLRTLATAKFRNSLVGAGTFSIMSGSSMGMRHLANRYGAAGGSLSGEVLAGSLSGIPGGLFHAQADSLLQGKGLAGRSQTGDAMLGFSLIGGLMPVGQRAVRRACASDQSASRYRDASIPEPTSNIDQRTAASLRRTGEAPAVPALKEVFLPSELETIKSWKEQQSRLAPTNLRTTEPQLLERLAAEEYGNGALRQERQLHMLLGNCGAGKSTLCANLQRQLGALAPDADRIKPKIKGYSPEPGKEGMGNQAVHPDSEAAYKILFDRALQRGDNLIWQGCGENPAVLHDVISTAKGNGYNVVLHFIDAPPEVAARRVYHRASQPADPITGIRQMIPPEVPLNEAAGYGYGPRRVFLQTIGASATPGSQWHGLVDGYRLWNSAPRQSGVQGIIPAWRSNHSLWPEPVIANDRTED